MSLRLVEARSVEEAVAVLGSDPAARCIAGGVTLIGMMNAGLIEDVSVLVDLRLIGELQGISRSVEGAVRLGAMVRHAETARSSLLIDGQRVLTEAVRSINNPAIQNMGTIGGGVAFSDPASDYMAPLLALDAILEVAGPAGRRRVPMAEFGVDWYTNALEPGELLVAIEIPPAPEGSAGFFRKFARVQGDSAIVSVAIVLRAAQERVGHLRVAIGACGPKPIRLERAEECLIETALDPPALAAAGELLAQACDPIDDVRASAAYRRALVPRLFKNLLAEAWSRRAQLQ